MDIGGLGSSVADSAQRFHFLYWSVSNLASISGLEETGASIEDCKQSLVRAQLQVLDEVAMVPIGASAMLEVDKQN